MPTSSKHPPSWKLWHHSQGINFQPPLYPILNVARLTTEASPARDAETGSDGVSFGLQANAAMDESLLARPLVRNIVGAEDSTSTRSHTTLKTSGIMETQRKFGELRLENAPSREAITEQQQGVDSCGAPARPRAGDDTTDNDAAPFTPLDYRMPDDVFQTARAAPEGSADSFWSYSLYRGPGEEGKVKVHYCKSAQAAERALQYLVGEKHLGLDLEWVMDANRYSGARKNVSLVQMASQSRVVLLHIALYPAKDELATPTLRRILEDPGVTKLGVWIKGDCTKLRTYLGIDTQRMFELSHLFRQVKYSASGEHALINKKLVPLAKQVLEITGLPLKKEMNVRTSDWSQPLNMDQIGYSASDAYAAVQLFAMLNHQREQLDPTPALPYHADLNKPIPLPPDAWSESSADEDIEEVPADEAALEAEDIEESTASLQQEVFKIMNELHENLAKSCKEGDESQVDASNAPTKTVRRKATAGRSQPATKDPSQPRDVRVTAAEAWLAEFKESRQGQLKAPPSALRAYHVWHSDAALDAKDVAQLLRDPPLQASTVASYILTSLKLEQLPYDKMRVKTGVLAYLPEDILRRRFHTFSKLLKDSHH